MHAMAPMMKNTTSWWVAHDGPAFVGGTNPFDGAKRNSSSMVHMPHSCSSS